MNRRKFLKTSGTGVLAMTAFANAKAAVSNKDKAAVPNKNKPNILFIVTDQQFGEAMSCSMGTKYINTPAIDSLAANGVRFDRAYAANPLCTPSRTSMMTGLYPHESGIEINFYGGEVKAKNFTCMGEAISDGGYDAGYFGKWHVAPLAGKKSGFEMKSQGSDSIKTDALIEYISRDRDKPFFAVVSFLNPHDICAWPRGHRKKESQDPVGSAPAMKEYPPAPVNLLPQTDEVDAITRYRTGLQKGLTFPVGDFKAEDWRQHRWAYYRMVEKIDHEVSRIMKSVRSLGLEENTVILFTSDHGECNGAHQYSGKVLLYEESSRVPMIISWKDKIKPQVCNKFVNTGIDTLPTVCDYAQVKPPAGLHGRSLVPLVNNTSKEWRDYVVVSNHATLTGPVDGIDVTYRARMLRTDRFKYCLYNKGKHRESLVDMEKDPHETVNLARNPKYKKTLLQHRKLLQEYAKETKDTVALDMLKDDVPPIAHTKYNNDNPWYERREVPRIKKAALEKKKV